MDSRFRRVITYSQLSVFLRNPLFIYGFMFVSEGQLSPNCSLNSVFELAYMLKSVFVTQASRPLMPSCGAYRRARVPSQHILETQGPVGSTQVLLPSSAAAVA